MIKIEFSRKFVKSLKKAPKKIQFAFRNRLEIFISDKYNPLLNNHSLIGKYQEYRSISVTGDWRALYKEHGGGKIAYFITIDTHSNLYK